MYGLLQKHTIRLFIATALATVGLALFAPVMAHATPAPTPPPPAATPAPIKRPSAPDQCPKGDCIITGYVNPAIKALSALVGVLVTISIVVGGIQYASSGDDSGKVAAAKDKITKALLALACYIFLYAFLNWIVPGGIG